MPNWCEDCLEVIGDENEIKRFCETGLTTVVNKDGEIEQEWSLLPYYPYPDGKWDYDWCVDNWGTKWDVDEPIHECNGESFWVTFNTAWAPPVNWLKKVQQDYPLLKFKLLYIEQGMQFCGISFTQINDDNNGVFIVDYCDDICDYVNEDDESVTYDKERELWFVDSTGEEMDEDSWTTGRNHFDDFEVWFESQTEKSNDQPDLMR